LEALVAGPAIAQAAQQRLRNGEASSLAGLDISQVNAQDVAAAARQGDRLAVDIFNRVGRLLGFAVANLVSLLDPEIIILAGGMAAVADLYLRPLQKAMFEHAQPLAAARVSVVVSRMAETVNLLGCARLAWGTGRTQRPAQKIRSSATSGNKQSRTQKGSK
jgi:predicted NBD/HSP70 family sugar kinase